MLSAIRGGDSKKVLAWEEAKSNKPFFCPRCFDAAILKKGTVRIHHFAHKPPVTCEYGLGESEQHRRCKLEIYEGLLKHRRFVECEIERDMGTVRPDFSAYMDGIQIAIEVQISALTMDQIIYRTSEYAKKGIYVLWLSIYTDALDDEKYSPKLWERWCHAAYLGRVYYWLGGLEVAPIHFDECSRYIEQKSWYTQGGDEMSAGGYEKKYRRFKTPNHGRTVNLSDSFIPKYREQAWRSQTLSVPRSRLLIDYQPVWWRSEFIPPKVAW